MSESKSGGTRWVVGLALVATIAVGSWLVLGGSPDGPDGPAAATAPAAAPAPPTPAAAPLTEIPELRIAANGRLALDEAALPEQGPLTLALELTDEARGSGERQVRVISANGRRIDTTASPLSGAGSGVRLELDPAFLSPGRYMIEIDTVDNHPLRIRRYVLEVR
jgi:hypothetical protein